MKHKAARAVLLFYFFQTEALVRLIHYSHTPCPSKHAHTDGRGGGGGVDAQ